ncbi:hypothetical protein [Stakelama pacifica]|uniref:Transcriptional regulator n=1 Tax=Stakelama pacifica TaxID=517720 RepID=A0A4R6FDQ0_9SPHN|nr:hypothetical protein [Stakelama pacifica]MAW98145.1 hypothetical protein [Sphingomonas sp.]TDN78790.1 hypothetical protein EV664_11554 [Stakelama pacifica]GGO99098.1 hypothetical protein GCM10011329_31790 [Stakelama pacifica]
MALLWKIERYLRRTDMPPTTFGRLAVGDPRFVRDLRNGREPRQSMVDRIEAFIERNSEPRA